MAEPSFSDDGRSDVKELLMDAVRKGEPSQGSQRSFARYSHSPDPETTGIGEMSVRIDSTGRVLTAFPEDGPDVAVWLRDAGGWESDV